MNATAGIDKKAAEARLRKAAKKRDEGIAEVDQAVVDTADSVSRRRAAELIDRTPGRVQQIIDQAREKIGGE